MAVYYWVNKGGNWTDLSHWSNVSGGAGNAYSVAPGTTDDVIFDQNSKLTGETVVCPAGEHVKNFVAKTGTQWIMDHSAGSVAFTDNLVLEAGLVQSAAAGGQFIFEGTGQGTVRMNGNKGFDYFDIYQINSGLTRIGTLTLQDDFEIVKDLYMEDGTLDLNGFNWTSTTFECDNYDNGAGKLSSHIYLRSGTVKCKFFNLYPETALNFNIDFHCGSSTIQLYNRSFPQFGGGGNFNCFDQGPQASGGAIGAFGYTFNKVWFNDPNSGNSVIDGGYNFAEIRITNNAQLLWEKSKANGGGGIYQIGSLVVDTPCVFGTEDAFSGSELTVTHALNATGAIISVDKLTLKHSVATPAGMWYAGKNSTNNQGIADPGSGWIFGTPTQNGFIGMMK